MTRFSQYLTPEKLYPTRGPCVLLESAELFAHILQVYHGFWSASWSST